MRPVFEDHVISHRADVYLGAAIWYWAIKDKWYGDNLKTVEVLKDNIREAIGEIQLHTIDNVLKNWLLYGQPRQLFE